MMGVRTGYSPELPGSSAKEEQGATSGVTHQETLVKVPAASVTADV